MSKLLDGIQIGDFGELPYLRSIGQIVVNSKNFNETSGEIKTSISNQSGNHSIINILHLVVHYKELLKEFEMLKRGMILPSISS